MSSPGRISNPPPKPVIDAEAPAPEPAKAARSERRKPVEPTAIVLEKSQPRIDAGVTDVSATAVRGLSAPTGGVGQKQPRPVQSPTVDAVQDTLGRPTLRQSDVAAFGMLGTFRPSGGALQISSAMGLQAAEADWSKGGVGAVTQVPRGDTAAVERVPDELVRRYESIINAYPPERRAQVRAMLYNTVLMNSAQAKAGADAYRYFQQRFAELQRQHPDASPADLRRQAQQEASEKFNELYQRNFGLLLEDPSALGALVLPDLPYMDEAVRALMATPEEFQSYVEAGIENVFPRLVQLYGDANAFANARNTLVQSLGWAATRPSGAFARMELRNRFMVGRHDIEAKLRELELGKCSLDEVRAYLQELGLELVDFEATHLTIRLAEGGDPLRLKISHRRDGSVRLVPPRPRSHDVETFGIATFAASAVMMGLGDAVTSKGTVQLTRLGNAGGTAAHAAASDAHLGRGAGAPIGLQPGLPKAREAERDSAFGLAVEAARVAAVRSQEAIEEAHDYADRIAFENRDIERAEIKQAALDDAAKPGEPVQRVPVAPRRPR